MTFRVSAAGDIYGRELVDGSVEDVDPECWGWSSPGHEMPPAARSTIDELAALPGFTVTVTAARAFVPGPRRRGAKWMEWPEGAAPPAAYESALGAGGYYSRLSELLGYVAVSLPRNPASSPYVVYDFVAGRRLDVAYQLPPVRPGGEGLVYVVDDGYAFKVGHTTKAPAIRITGLQTANPRLLRTVATIAPASPDVEAHIHHRLATWHIRGEWYAREPILDAVHAAGGWELYLHDLLPDGAWEIWAHPGGATT